MTSQVFLDNAILIPLLPLAAAILVGLFGRRVLYGSSHWPVIVGVALSLAMSVGLIRTSAYRLDLDRYRLQKEESRARSLARSFRAYLGTRHLDQLYRWFDRQAYR